MEISDVDSNDRWPARKEIRRVKCNNYSQLCFVGVASAGVYCAMLDVRRNTNIGAGWNLSRNCSRLQSFLKAEKNRRTRGGFMRAIEKRYDYLFKASHGDPLSGGQVVF